MSPIVSPRHPRGHSHQPPLSAHQPLLSVQGGRGEPREPQTGGLDLSEPRRPALRLVAEENHEVAPVLLAGADASRRAVLRAEFGATLPPCTPFSEAEDVSEVLERAPSSRMVILAGDVDDADAQSLMRLLGRRHPRLPVISVDATMPVAAGGHG